MQVSQIKEAFKKSGIKKNDSIIIHGDAGIAEQIKINKKDKVNFFLNLLIKLIGEKGSIIVPAFTYNACKTKIFDKQKDKAETGLFSEIFRKKKILIGQTILFLVLVFMEKTLNIFKKPV